MYTAYKCKPAILLCVPSFQNLYKVPSTIIKKCTANINKIFNLFPPCFLWDENYFVSLNVLTWMSHHHLIILTMFLNSWLNLLPGFSVENIRYMWCITHVKWSMWNGPRCTKKRKMSAWTSSFSSSPLEAL